VAGTVPVKGAVELGAQHLGGTLVLVGWGILGWGLHRFGRSAE
jgi:hypothetical protein